MNVGTPEPVGRSLLTSGSDLGLKPGRKSWATPKLVEPSFNHDFRQARWRCPRAHSADVLAGQRAAPSSQMTHTHRFPGEECPAENHSAANGPSILPQSQPVKEARRTATSHSMSPFAR